jgi:hypothetical protein
MLNKWTKISKDLKEKKKAVFLMWGVMLIYNFIYSVNMVAVAATFCNSDIYIYLLYNLFIIIITITIITQRLTSHSWRKTSFRYWHFDERKKTLARVAFFLKKKRGGRRNLRTQDSFTLRIVLLGEKLFLFFFLPKTLFK